MLLHMVVSANGKRQFGTAVGLIDNGRALL